MKGLLALLPIPKSPMVNAGRGQCDGFLSAALPLGGFCRFASGMRLKLRPAPIFVDVPSFAHASLLAQEAKS